MIQIQSQFSHYCLCEQCNECWSAFSGFKFSNDNDITLQLKYNAYTLLNYFLEHSYISNYHSSPHEGSMSVFLQNGTHPEALTNSGHMCVCVFLCVLFPNGVLNQAAWLWDTLRWEHKVFHRGSSHAYMLHSHTATSITNTEDML